MKKNNMINKNKKKKCKKIQKFACFFFKQKTAYEMRISDWSSDVCSSDLHRHRDRVVSVDRLLGVVAVQQPHRSPTAQVDRRVQLHQARLVSGDRKSVV